MSESDGDDELEFDGVRSRLESGFYPTLMGPGPKLTVVLALALTQPILWLVPEALLFLVCAIVFFLTASVMALRARSRGNRHEALIVALAAATIFIWALGVYFSFASHSIALAHAILAASAILIAGARHADCFRYAAAVIAQRTDDWREEDLANYAEFLLSRRPGPGAKTIARQLYERASLALLDRNWPIARQINVVERYVMLLEKGIGGRSDHQNAEWWREKAEDLRWWTVVRGSGTENSPQNPSAGDGLLAYDDLLPVWRARLDEGGKYEPGGVATLFHAFLLPESALVACVVRLPGGDDGAASTILHHVFDVSSPESETYLSALEHRLSWRIELYHGDPPTADASGPKPDVTVDISLEGSGIMESIDAAMIHNNNLGQNVDSRSALGFFLNTIELHRGRGGVDAAWTEIETACLKVDD